MLVVGAGLGGITAGLALARQGVEVSIVEQATDIRHIQVGIGMALWPNGMRALQTIDAAEDAESAGHRIANLRLLSASGAQLNSLDVESLGREIGSSAIGITRAALHKVIADKLPRDMLRLGARCVSYRAGDDGRMTLELDDGREEHADIIVAADGVASSLRTSAGLADGDFPPYKYLIWHSVIEFPDRDLMKPGDFNLSFGRGLRFSAFRVSDGDDRVYWGALGYVPADQAYGEGVKAYLRTRFAAWEAPVLDLIEATPEADIGQVPIFGGKLLPRLRRARLVLLGDAAHPLTTTMGQGGGMALEDAIVLSESIARSSDADAALDDYEGRRLPRLQALFGLIDKMSSAASQETAARVWLRDHVVIPYLFPAAVKSKYARFIRESVDAFGASPVTRR